MNQDTASAISTPEFVRWALEAPCPWQAAERGNFAEQTERQLKALRCCSDGRREGRIFSGVCLEQLIVSPPSRGFIVGEVLAAYGGEAAVSAACGVCPANAAPADDAARLAGCFGHLECPLDPAVFHGMVDAVLKQCNGAPKAGELFLPTRPAWYGLWADSPLSAPQARFLLEFCRRLWELLPEAASPWNNFFAVLEAGLQHCLPLHVQLTPRGFVRGRYWYVSPHCPRCRCDLPEMRRQHCRACGELVFPLPQRRRHVRGNRPFQPLARFMGPENLAALLAAVSEAVP